MANKIVFMSFEDARKFMHEQHIHGVAKFMQWKERPGDIPSNPSVQYKNEWKGWGDFLGYEAKRGRAAKVCKSYTDAKIFVQSLKLNSMAEWKEYCQSGDLPDDIPSNPRSFYPEFEGMEAFFGFKPLPRGRPKKETMPVVNLVPEDTMKEIVDCAEKQDTIEPS